MGFLKARLNELKSNKWKPGEMVLWKVTVFPITHKPGKKTPLRSWQASVLAKIASPGLFSFIPGCGFSRIHKIRN
jgi:hypothetical protein